jgi:hypothetical protein
MAAQEVSFECWIVDRVNGDSFSALVTMSKHAPLDLSRRLGTFALAHLFITPISGQLVKSWGYRYAVHNHFVLENLAGRGRYIIRDRLGRALVERQGSIWDLGGLFALRVMEKLKRLT